MVAKINRGVPNFFDAPPAQTPLILAIKVIFGKLLTKPKLYTKFDVASVNGCRLLASVVEEINRGYRTKFLGCSPSQPRPR